HLARAVADAVGGGDGVLGLDQAQLELALALADAGLQPLVDRLDLGHDAEIALAVALGADNAHGRLMDQVRIRADRPCHADRLGGPAGMSIDENGVGCHRAGLPWAFASRAFYQKSGGELSRFGRVAKARAVSENRPDGWP